MKLLTSCLEVPSLSVEDKRIYGEVLYSTVSKGGKAHQRLHDKCKVVSEKYQGEGLVKVGYYRQVRG